MQPVDLKSANLRSSIHTTLRYHVPAVGRGQTLVLHALRKHFIKVAHVALVSNGDRIPGNPADTPVEAENRGRTIVLFRDINLRFSERKISVLLPPTNKNLGDIIYKSLNSLHIPPHNFAGIFR